jgi:hypothetical protein
LIQAIAMDRRDLSKVLLGSAAASLPPYFPIVPKEKLKGKRTGRVNAQDFQRWRCRGGNAVDAASPGTPVTVSRPLVTGETLEDFWVARDAPRIAFFLWRWPGSAICTASRSMLPPISGRARTRARVSRISNGLHKSAGSAAQA